jgi:hypothetical protein
LEALLRLTYSLHGLAHFGDIIRLIVVDDGERHPRILVRQGHNRLIHPPPGHQPPDPTAEAIEFLSHLSHDRSGPMNQQLSEIPIPPFTDSTEPDLPPGAGVLGHQPQGCRDMAAILGLLKNGT